MNLDNSKLLQRSASPLRVALVTETYPPEINGVAMTLGRIVDGLLRRQHPLQIIRPRQQAKEFPMRDDMLHEVLVKGFPIPRYPDLRFGLPAPNTLARLWSVSPPDIVHIATQGPLGWSAITAARKLNLPVSSSFHTNFDAYSRHYGLGLLKPLISGYLRHFHNRTDVTLVPTKGLAKLLRSEGYRNVDIVSRGVDTRLFNPGRRSTGLRTQWGIGAATLLVSYVGRLAPEKNLDLVFTTFDEIKRARPDARLLLVGDGPQRAARAARHPEHIFAGMRRGEDLAAHYASSDLFLFPSLTETFGNVTAEALASGLGVVSYDYAAAAELIEDGHNGSLVSPGDSAAFIESAVNLATNPSQLDRFKLRATTSIARLDWEHVHDGFAAILAELVATHERAHHAQNAMATN